MRPNRQRPLASAALICFVVVSLFYLYHRPRSTSTSGVRRPAPLPAGSYETAPPVQQSGPLQYINTQIHPVDQLIQDAQQKWTASLARQSQTLADAVAEYKRRYKMPPPPNFDAWYNFAKKHNVKLIDEYDTIYQSLLPFWGLSPATIRARTQEALGYSNMLVSLKIRDRKVVYLEDGPDWLKEAIKGMLEPFIKYLPDMDVAFNLHDEPRVVVPHDQLSSLLRIALDKNIPATYANAAPHNAFSQPPKDLQSIKRFDEVKTSRFNVFAHQQTWVPSRLSCPMDSPARVMDEAIARDNLTAWAMTDLGFVYNQTALSDICNSPSLGTSHGFFERP